MKAGSDRSAAQPGAVPEETRLSAWPGVARLRRAMDRHPTVTDALLVVVLVIGPAVVFGVAATGRSDPSTLVSDALDLAGCLVLLRRRRYPFPVFFLTGAFAAGGTVLGHGTSMVDLATLVALYTVAAYRPRRVASIAFVVAEIGLAALVLIWHGTGLHGQELRDEMIAAFVSLSCVAVTAFVLGVNMRTRRQYLASLQDRAERAERERDQQARIATAGERARIAREMHDIVAHNLSVMIALADGAAFAARTGSPEAEHAARQVSDTGRQALGEMRRLLGVLRDDEPGHGESGGGSPRAPQPGIAAIDDVVAQVRAAGLAARLAVEGEPFAVPQTAQLAVFRLVQESLTNVLKHAASPSEVRVRLRYDAPVVAVEVVDDGGEAAPASAGGGGHGLTGMRERAAMFGGEVSAGPRPGGGWRVAAHVDTARGDGDGLGAGVPSADAGATGAAAGAVPAGPRHERDEGPGGGVAAPRDGREERVGSR